MFLFQGFFQEPLRSRELLRFCSDTRHLGRFHTPDMYRQLSNPKIRRQDLKRMKTKRDFPLGPLSLSPARLLDMTESRAVTVGRKTARASVRFSLTPRWKLQQASLKENEMIASLKVGKQRQTSSTVILTPSISNGLASSCHVGRHMSLSLSLYLSPYSSQPQCTLIEKVAAHKHNTIEMQ